MFRPSQLVVLAGFAGCVEHITWHGALVPLAATSVHPRLLSCVPHGAMNQCMGCQAVWPLTGRAHLVIGGYHNERVFCTKGKYMEILKNDGTPCDRAPRGLNSRLADVFRAPGMGMVETLKELRELTAKDRDDFRAWFEAAGYPTPEAGKTA